MRKLHLTKKTALCMTAAFLALAAAGCSGNGEAAETSQAETSASQDGAGESGTEKAAEETEAAEVTEAAEGKAEERGEEVTLLVAAAASLKNVYEDQLIPLFEEENPGIHVEGTYDSSGKLQTQIEEGLEADIFMSAAVTQMTALDEGGFIDTDTISPLLENKIVLIVPEGNEGGLEAFEDIEKAESVALGDPASVPAGQYAKEALTSLGIWDSIQDKASFGTNVTEVLNQVAEASADAGIVYATDAASMSDKVDVIAEAPQGSLADKVIYPAAVVASSAHPEEAGKFLDFLKSEEAMAFFEEYGFSDGQAE